MTTKPEDERRIFDAMKRLVTTPPTVCAWCPGFDGHDPKHRHASHGICAPCAAKMAASKR